MFKILFRLLLSFPSTLFLFQVLKVFIFPFSIMFVIFAVFVFFFFPFKKLSISQLNLSSWFGLSGAIFSLQYSTFAECTYAQTMTLPVSFSLLLSRLYVQPFPPLAFRAATLSPPCPAAPLLSPPKPQPLSADAHLLMGRGLMGRRGWKKKTDVPTGSLSCIVWPRRISPASHLSCSTTNCWKVFHHQLLLA